MADITKEDFQQWKANKVTALFLQETEKTLQETREKPRIYINIDVTALENARTEGGIQAMEEALSWYEDKLSEFSEETNED